jgi:hypothetical protein
MSAVEESLLSHYSSEGLLNRIKEALTQAGVDPDHPRPEDLKPVDGFIPAGPRRPTPC